MVTEESVGKFPKLIQSYNEFFPAKIDSMVKRQCDVIGEEPVEIERAQLIEEGYEGRFNGFSHEIQFF